MHKRFHLMRNTVITIISALLISACNQTAQDPKTVADSFWHHLQTGNMLEAEKQVSSNSHHVFMENKMQLASIDKVDNTDAVTTVSTTITQIDPTTNISYTRTFDTILVLQQGEWKVDAERTPLPKSPGAEQADMQKLADDLSQSMQENMESLDEAMTRGMHMLNESLQDSSKEMGESLLYMMNELNSKMKESIDKMKQQRQQQEQQLPSPDPDKGEGKV